MLELRPGLWGGQVQDEEEETTALYVSQERDAQASIQMGSSNDAWDVGNYTE